MQSSEPKSMVYVWLFVQFIWLNRYDASMWNEPLGSVALIPIVTIVRGRHIDLYTAHEKHIYIYFYLSIYLSARLPACLQVCLSVCLIYLSFFLSTYLSIHLSIYIKKYSCGIVSCSIRCTRCLHVVFAASIAMVITKGYLNRSLLQIKDMR